MDGAVGELNNEEHRTPMRRRRKTGRRAASEVAVMQIRCSDLGVDSTSKLVP